MSLSSWELRTQQADLLVFRKPQRLVGTRHQRERPAVLCRNAIVAETVGRGIKARKCVLGQDGHPDITRRGHSQAVETTRVRSGERSIVGGNRSSTRIEPEQEPRWSRVRH